MKDNVFFYTGSGKAGNLVGQVRGGLQIFRAYQRNVRNPQTAAQVLQRARIAVYSKLSKALVAAVNIGYKGVSNTLRSPRNMFVKDNYTRGVVTGSSPTALDVDEELIQVSRGGLVNPMYGQMAFTRVDGHITMTGTTATYIPGYLEENDRVRLVVYCPDYDLAVINDDRTTVDEAISGGVNIMIPPSWEQLKVYVYAFITRPGETGNLSASTSVFLGAGNIQ